MTGTHSTMRTYSPGPQELVGSLWRNRGLIRALTWRDISSRYRGSVAGILWTAFNPLLMLLVYTFVFSVVFNARWGTDGETSTQFAMVLFAGLIVFNLFAECVTRAPGVVVLHSSYVKRVVFPIEILPWVLLGSALFHSAVSLLVWLALSLVVFGLPPASVVLFPVVLLPALLLTAGVSWLLASLGVYLRDIAQIVGIVTTALLFLSPVFYPVSALPEGFQRLVYLNPLTLAIESGRNVLIWGTLPDWRLLTAYLVSTGLIACLGFFWFQKTRRGFADVL